MNNYHPIVEILLDHYGSSKDSLKPLHEQLLAYRENIEGLKEVLIKHNVTNEISFQKALASYFELDYIDDFKAFWTDGISGYSTWLGSVGRNFKWP